MAQAESVSTAIRELMSRGGSPKSTSPVRAAFTELVAALAGHPPHPIPVGVDSDDLEGRADHLERALRATDVYLKAILADTAENIPGGTLDCKYLGGLFAEFAAEAVGGIRNAADALREHETWRAA